jgi:ferredoxin--NADP+ reductase
LATYTTEHVLAVRHWNDKLFSFTTTRGPGLRFENGQFIMLGLEVDGRKIVRAYSIASANYEEQLEFYSIKVPGGPLTSRLQHIQPGTPVLVSSKPTGTLVLRDTRPGKRLFMMATGTGVAPFLGLAKDPATYEQYSQVVLVRGARVRTDLAYADSVLERLRRDPDLGEMIASQLLDYPSLTREAYRTTGRITSLLESGRLLQDLDLPPLDPATDRFMICGNMRMLADLSRMLDARGFTVSPHIGVPGDYVIERAFVETFDPAPQVQTEALPTRAADFGLGPRAGLVGG